ncbi:MAG: signal peptide peptidase SppA [Candidatus Kapaibacterium sp.]
MADERPQQQGQGAPPYPPHYYRRERKSKWWIPVLVIGIIIVLFIVFIGAVFAMIGSAFEPQEVTVKENSILHLKFDEVEEYSETSPFQFLTPVRKASFRDILSAIERAKYDDNIKGIYYTGSGNVGFAKASEIQEALTDFKGSGKFIYAYIEMGNEYTYYNSLPADSIFMPREGLLEMNGLGASAMFLKGFYDKLGINFHVENFEDFKSAAETNYRKSWSDSARHQLKVILDQRYENLLDAIADFRESDKEKIREVMAKGVYEADSLYSLGLIDALMVESQIKDHMKNVIFGDNPDDKEIKLVSAGKYMASNPKLPGKIADEDKQIAIVYGVGPIVPGKPDAWTNEQQIYSEDFVENLRDAADNDKVKAIILRIDSPGGSVIASEEIWKEVQRVSKEKPVYASMSDIAASGGYYIAMACDTIIAHPSTMTGSIGVIVSLPNFDGTLDKLDITVDTISTGPAAQDLNLMMPFDERQKEKLHIISKNIYQRFVSKAAKARGMDFEEMRSLAKGRVWTGADAKEKNLVDVLGDFGDAINLAKKRIGIEDTMRVYVQIYPRPQDDIEALLKIFGLNETSADADINTLAARLNIDPMKMTKIWNSLPASVKKQVVYQTALMDISSRERVMVALPQLYDIR